MERFERQMLISIAMGSSLHNIWANCGEEERQPNQALQTTPVTRSVYEKTIEFGHRQRGV